MFEAPHSRAQIDINNALSYTKLEEKVLVDGDDCCINIRIEGEFYEKLELQNFPFDVQGLKLDITVNTRTTGPVPVALSAAPNLVPGVILEGFQVDNLWRMDTTQTQIEGTSENLGAVIVTPFIWGRRGRQFPCMRLTMKVHRRPTFYTVNVVCPMASFVMLSFTQYPIPYTDSPDRLSITLTLVLTAAAYKFAVSSLVPTISYLTLLDYYVLFSWLVIMLNGFEGGFVGLISNEDQGRQWDQIFMYMIGGLWIALHLGFAWKIISCKNGTVKTGKTSVEVKPY